MKVLCSLLAIYILSISVLPCNDVHEGSAHAVTTIAQAQQHHEQDNDICSPFCVCSCCQTVVVLTGCLDLKLSSTLSVLDFPGYIPRFHSSNLPAIWQPPRLS